MRLNVYDLFTVKVVRPDGGWSKGRPIAFIEEGDKCVPVLDLLLPNDLNDAALAGFVADRFAAFARSGKSIVLVDDARDLQVRNYNAAPNRQGVAHPAFAGVQH